MRELPHVGTLTEIDYPTHNRLDLPLEFIERRIILCHIDDRRGRPVAVESFLKSPLVRRGSILLFGVDLDIPFGQEQERTFYWEAAQGGVLPGYQLGLYDPAEPDDSPEWLGRIFWPTHRDRLLMQDAICKFKKKIRGRLDNLKLGAFPVVEE